MEIKNDTTTNSRRLILNTLAGSRKTLSRILRDFHDDKLERGKYRDLIYGFSCLLGFWKVDALSELESRIKEIEKAQSDTCSN